MGDRSPKYHLLNIKIKYFFIPWSAGMMDEGYPRAEARAGRRHMRYSCLFSDLFPVLWPHLTCHLPFRFHHLVGDNEERLKGEYFCLFYLGNASSNDSACCMAPDITEQPDLCSPCSHKAALSTVLDLITFLPAYNGPEFLWGPLEALLVLFSSK